MGRTNHYIWVMDCWYPKKMSCLWWMDGKGLLRGCPGLLPGASPLLGCRGWGWWLGLMALYPPTSDLFDTNTGEGRSTWMGTHQRRALVQGSGPKGSGAQPLIRGLLPCSQKLL